MSGKDTSRKSPRRHRSTSESWTVCHRLFHSLDLSVVGGLAFVPRDGETIGSRGSSSRPDLLLTRPGFRSHFSRRPLHLSSHPRRPSCVPTFPPTFCRVPSRFFLYLRRTRGTLPSSTTTPPGPPSTSGQCGHLYLFLLVKSNNYKLPQEFYFFSILNDNL